MLNIDRIENINIKSDNKLHKFRIAIPVDETIGLSKETQPICEQCGMLFDFPSLNPSISMNETKIPLDIVFIENGIITGIEYGIPYSKDIIQGEGDTVIEFNINTMEKLNIKVGDKVIGLPKKQISTKLSTLDKFKKGGKATNKKETWKTNLRSTDNLNQKHTKYFFPSISGKENNKRPLIRYANGGKEFKSKNSIDMYLLDENGKPQMKLEGNERIFSRIDTRKIVSMAKKINTDQDLIKLGDYVAKVIYKQDYINKPEFVNE